VTGRAVKTDVLAHASVRASQEKVCSLRRKPGNLGGSVLPPARLKHADEQTVVGLSAVLQAIEDAKLDPAGFGEWAVLAASRFLGRSIFNKVFPQFLVEGAWGVSPHLVANHSLHAVSGMISQILKTHGANLGVGGGPGGDVEALLTAASWLDSGAVPGVWVVFTGSNNPTASPDIETEYEALALALSVPRPVWSGLRLSVRPGSIIVEPQLITSEKSAVHVGSTLWRVDPGSKTSVRTSRLLPDHASRTTEPEDAGGESL
jgi:hypothetical protein